MAIDMGNHPYGPGSHAPLADKREMPACYPIKGNENSKKFHRPDSQGYGQTIAEVWFDSPSAAEAAGFSLAGGHSEDGRNEDYEPGGSGHPCTVDAVNAARAAAGAGGATTVTSGSATVDGVAGQAGITTEISGEMPDVDGGGVSGKAAAAGAAGVAGAAGLAAAAGGKLGDLGDKIPGAGDLTADISAPDVNVPDVSMPDVNMPDVDVPDVSAPDVNISTPNVDVSAPDISTPDVSAPDVDMPDGGGISGKAAAAGAAGVAGAAGLAAAAGGKLGDLGDVGGKVTGAAGDLGGKVTGGVTGATGKVTGAAGGALSGAKGAAGGIGGKATAAAGAGAAAVGGTVRRDVNVDYDGGDDDEAGLMGCLRKWWWLLALLLGVLLLGLLLSQCGGGDDGDAEATPAAVTEAPTTTEAATTTEAPTTTEAEPETTTTEAETTTTTEAPAEEEEIATLAGVAEGTSPTVYSILGPLGLAAALESEGPITVFLPSDAGATQVITDNPDLLTDFQADPAAAAAILGYHVVPGVFKAEDLAGGATLVTSTGLEITIADGAVNGVEITSTDSMGSNGVIHVINGVLLPPANPQLAVTGTTTELAGAIGGAFLVLGATMVYAARRREDEELAA